MLLQTVPNTSSGVRKSPVTDGEQASTADKLMKTRWNEAAVIKGLISKERKRKGRGEKGERKGGKRKARKEGSERGARENVTPRAHKVHSLLLNMPRVGLRALFNKPMFFPGRVS